MSMACVCGHAGAGHEQQVGGCCVADCGCATFVLWTAPARTARCACGADVEISFEAGVPSWFVAHARRMADPSTAVQCEACSDAATARQEAAERAAERAEAVERRRVASGMPRKWLAQRFAGLEDDAARRRPLELAGEWGRGEISGLLLWGPVGRGKTAIAAAAANLRVERGHLRWLPVAELLLDLCAPFDSDRRERAVARLDASRGTAALVLDDLDKLKPTEHAVQPLYLAVNAWVEAELPLLVTCNRPLEQLADWMPETFGHAIASRLSGSCAISNVGGRDRRLAGARHHLELAGGTHA